MIARNAIGFIAATAAVGSLLAVGNPAAHADSWTKLWQSQISKDYLQGHGRWVSQGDKLPAGSRMARGVFYCSGGGPAELTVLDLDSGQQGTKDYDCDGNRHYTPVVAYHNGETVKLILKSPQTTTVEEWAGR